MARCSSSATMKQTSRLLSTLVLAIIVVVSFHTTMASRFGWPPRPEEALKITEPEHGKHAGPEEKESLDMSLVLLGMEDFCKAGTEECPKRRMMYEAHLDYIYTQHHPKP